MGRIAAKIDANQPEIVAALRAVGCTVQSLAEVGDGCPDLLVGIKGVWFLLEVKMPGETLNPRQKRWHAEAHGRTHLVRTADEALAIYRSYLTYGSALTLIP